MPGNTKWTEKEKDLLWTALDNIVSGKSIDSQLALLSKKKVLQDRTPDAIRRKLFYLKRHIHNKPQAASQDGL